MGREKSDAVGDGIEYSVASGSRTRTSSSSVGKTIQLRVKEPSQAVCEIIKVS